METMPITFFHVKGICHSEFIPKGHTVIQIYYVEIIKLLPEAVRSKRPELWHKDWIPHIDNAPAHKAPYVKQSLTQESITKMEHPPYSPDLASNDLWLFPKTKSGLKTQKFQGNEDIQKET
jgi:histone-lysine N-methyltransferase SETMAR